MPYFTKPQKCKVGGFVLNTADYQLSGDYTLHVPWQPPQKVSVRQVGCCYLFSFLDQLGRETWVEGREVGFGVAEFRSRDLFRQTTFVVYGSWEKAKYRNWRGQEFDLQVSPG